MKSTDEIIQCMRACSPMTHEFLYLKPKGALSLTPLAHVQGAIDRGMAGTKMGEHKPTAYVRTHQR